MAYSVIEKKFENQCHSIHPDIDCNMFFKEYNDYEQCIPLLRELFSALHQYVHDKLPNMDMTFTARLKAKKSFLDKKLLKLSESISDIFCEGDFDPKRQEEAINTYLSMLSEKKFNEVKQQIIACSASGLGTKKSFKLIFDDLSDNEKKLFIKRISRTSDTFAYSFIVKSVTYPIQNFITLPDGSFGIISDGEIHPIQTSIKFDPKKDVVEKAPYIYVINVDGKEYPYNPEYFEYPTSVSYSQRSLETASRDENGMVKLYGDSILLPNGDTCPIDSITFDEKKNSYFVITPEGDSINLTSRLVDNLALKKYDEKTCEQAILNTLKPVLSLFNSENNFRTLIEKDYIANPKTYEDTDIESYKALHNCLLNLKYKYKIEGQLRTFLANILYNYDHDAHKQENAETHKASPILEQIYEEDPLALDNSTATLVNILESNPDVDILDLMPTYFVTTTFPKR